MARKSTKNHPTETEYKPPAIKTEVQCIMLAAGGLLLFVSIYIPGAAGPVGDFVSNFLRGLFGAGAFIMPVTLLGLAVLGILNRTVRIPYIKLLLVFWIILALLHIFFQHPFSGLTIGERFSRIFDVEAAHPFGGGIIGAILGNLTEFLFRTVGAVIVLLTALTVLLVLVTGRSFVNFLGKGVDVARDYYDSKGKKIKSAPVAPTLQVEPEATVSEPIRRAKVIKEVRKSPVTLGKSPLYEIEGLDELEPTTKVLLIHEEIEERKQQKKASNPLFSRRNDNGTLEPIQDVIAFPVEAIMDEVEYEYYDDDEYYDEEEYEVIEPDHEDDYIYADDVYETRKEEPIIESYGSGLIVKGLVADVDEAPVVSVEKTEIEDFELDKETGIKKVSQIRDEIEQGSNDVPDFSNYKMPGVDLLAINYAHGESQKTRHEVIENSRILEETLKSFKIEARVIEVSVGPTVTRYDLAPGPGVKVSSIVNLANDLALSLAAQGIRIEAPIPGKSAVGIEIPNKEAQPVFLREIIEDVHFENFVSKLAFAVGKDIAGEPVIADIARMPHLLIAGATGSGKSVCINTLITSILYKARPDEVKLLMIDPKVVELSVYNGIPHLLIPVVTDPRKASGALNWAVQEMEKRYNLFAQAGCRDLKGYNAYVQMEMEPVLPQIVIIIDELADLMMAAKGEVEESICRLAQKARAAGIHLIVATQRPSVDVITGLIKANIPSRLAFAVSSGIDSRTVIDMYGAEKLLGKGDMLFLPMGQNKPLRVQGGFISDKEVENLVRFLKKQAPIVHSTEMIQQVTMPGKALVDGEVDEFFHEAIEFLITKGKASTSMLQRQFRIGYNRASRLMEDLETRGIVGPEDGVKPRKVTITRQEYKELYG